MIPFGTIALVFAAAYAAQSLLLAAGLLRACRKGRARDDEPTVSVIVAARNEEEHLERCLGSLLALEYPPSKLEIVVVNDSSTDGTSAIVEKFCADGGSGPRRIGLATTPGRGNLRGKTNAVALGIERSSGEILLFTDADCAVPRTWVRATLAAFEPQTGVVGGFTALGGRGLFAAIQRLDWFFLFGLASSMAAWGLPLTAIGNNLAVRRAAYDRTGGLAAIPFSVTEDYALVRAIYAGTTYRVRFPLEPKALVTSLPCATVSQLYRQKQRWGVGGLDMVFRGMFIMAVGWLAHAALIASLFISPAAFGPAAALVFGGEILFLAIPSVRLGRTSSLLAYPLFALYSTIYFIAIPFIAGLSRGVVWKERRL